MNCADCSDILRSGETIFRCASTDCLNRYHKACVNKTTNTVGSNFFWFCDSCSIALKKNNVICDNQDIAPHQEYTETGCQTFAEDTTTSYLPLNQATSSEKSLNEIHDKLIPILHDITIPIVDTIDSLKNVVFELGSQISYITQDCSKLYQNLDSIEAHSKKRNIEITGIPFRTNEKVDDIFVKICNLLGIELKLEYHVARLFRIKPRDNNNSRKSIIVEFKDQSTRDKFLSKAKLSKELLLANLGFQGSLLRFFVNEHLTHLKKHILYNLKQFKQDIKYKRLWVSGGQIYVRFPDRVLNVSSKAILSGLLNRRN